MRPFLNEPLKSHKKMFFGGHIKDGRQNINFLKIVTEVKYPVIKVKGQGRNFLSQLIYVEVSYICLVSDGSGWGTNGGLMAGVTLLLNPKDSGDPPVTKHPITRIKHIE